MTMKACRARLPNVMSDGVALTLLSGLVQGIHRERRLLRIQTDNLIPRMAALEPPFHDLAGAVGRGFGQLRQQIVRQDQRLEALDNGLTARRPELSDSTTRIIQAIRGEIPR
jgi:hypothetical protein